MNLRNELQTFKAKFDPIFLEQVTGLLEQYKNFSDTTSDLDVTIESILIPYASGGKRIRPFLLEFLSTEKASQDQLQAAELSLELFHLAALIHDDIMDESPVRRGVPTLHVGLAPEIIEKSRLPEDIALLLGDGCIIASLEHSYRLSTVIQQEITTMMQRTIRGQYLDVYDMNQPYGSSTSEQVFTRHRLKTAWYTFGSPARIAFLLNQKDETINQSALEKITQIFVELGILFQIRDDIIDCIPDASKKNPFGDIKENQTTWVTLYLQEHHPEKFTELVNHKNNGDYDAVEKLFESISFQEAFERQWQQRESIVNDFSIEYPQWGEKAQALLSLLTL